MTGADPEILDELLQDALEVRHLGLGGEASRGIASSTEVLPTDELLDIVRHRDLFEALYENPLDRHGLEDALDVSRATSHRFTRWLESKGYATRTEGVTRLTGEGEVVAEALVRFERTVRTADRLAPLLDVICEDHRDFVVEPFENATVTEATPADPYAPMARFLSLLRGCERFRGFNTTHMVPPGLADIHGDPFSDCTVELIYLPDVVRALREADDADGRLERQLADDHLKLRTRDALPYGLALFDDRVGIGGYDDETGTMRVFVDTDTAIARAWAERVYETFRENSTPLAPDAA